MAKQKGKKTSLMPLDEAGVKSVYFRCYDDGIAEGKSIVKVMLDRPGEDLLDDVIADLFSGDEKTWQRFEENGFEDHMKVVKAFIDGIEDGLRSGIGNLRRDYERRLREEFE